MPEHFDKLLLDHIRNGRNDEAKSMLNEAWARTIADPDEDDYGTLLHHAVWHDNVVIARKLIELGADVNWFGGHCPTPLAVAVTYNNAAVFEILIEAGARLDIVDDDGHSALQLGLDEDKVDSELFTLLVSKFRSEARTSDEVAEILIRAGCNMYHAAMLRDVEVMECMLRRGVDVNSKGPSKETALHVAVKLADVNLADWSLKKGVDINASDDSGSSALLRCVKRRNNAMVRCLLERGARLDAEDGGFYTPLFVAFSRLREGPDELVECAEILLQHGANLLDGNIKSLLYFALKISCDKAVKLLIARLAMLEMLGEPVDKSVMRSVADNHQAKMSELRKYYEPCQQVLAIKVFEKWSLLDLLSESDRKIKLLARKKTFFEKVQKISFELKLRELYPFYYNAMMRRIEKASRVVELEDEASLVICKIFEATYNQFYVFARGVVEYLNVRDLENLVQV